MAASQRRLAAIMFTDMVGYSALAQADEASALSLLERHNGLLRPIFSKYGGREIKTVGDAFLVEFGSALDAAQCAMEIQRALHDYNAASGDRGQIRTRIGLHVGDVVESDGDVLGDAVNIASRIEPLAEPGGVCLSQQVYDQVRNKIATPFVRLPPVALKNIRSPVAVYRLVQPWDVPPVEVRPPSPSRQLAVLPLANISPDPHDEYFADGLTEELISVLSQVQDLSVIARTSVTPYKTAPKSIAEVGAELGVDTVLEGSVRKSGNRIRITLQLVDVSSQRHIWASSYNRELDDVFAVQTDIAQRTADALQLQLGTPSPPVLGRKPTANPEAYDLYLRGLVLANQDHDQLESAVDFFDRATKLDPDFAEAYAAWANLYVTVAGDHVPMRDVMPRAKELAARAIALDPDSSMAHAALGNIAMQFDNDWARAEAEFTKAIALNPSNVTACQFYALMLLAFERFEEAKEIAQRLIQLDPGGSHWHFLAWAYVESGDPDQGIAFFRQKLADSPATEGDHVYLGLSLVRVGRRSEALEEAAYPVSGEDDVARFDHALLNAVLGRPEEARAVLAEAERGEAKSYTSGTHLAMLHSALGNRDRAIELLEADYRNGERVLWLWYRGPMFDPIRTDPRFVELLRQYGLPTRPARELAQTPVSDLPRDRTPRHG